jgi:quercetin dioxygenase-like cupin family protein
MRRLLLPATLALLAAAALPWAAGAGRQDTPHEGRVEVFPADKVQWKPGPPSLPKGAMFAVLEGDPSKEGPFVFRVKVPDGYRVPPHTHPKAERITVLAGTFYVGMGAKADEGAYTAMPAGTYGHWPAGVKHFVKAKGETVLQFHGTGPWAIQYVNPADDPRNKRQ